MPMEITTTTLACAHTHPALPELTWMLPYMLPVVSAMKRTSTGALFTLTQICQRKDERGFMHQPCVQKTEGGEYSPYSFSQDQGGRDVQQHPVFPKEAEVRVEDGILYPKTYPLCPQHRPVETSRNIGTLHLMLSLGPTP
jgi:hypothetical protein